MTHQSPSPPPKPDDYAWIRGANYVSSNAINTVEIWRDFDPDLVDRELGFAERLELNSLRIFLQYHVYEHNPIAFLKKVETFVALCDKRGIRPMLILFDGCFSMAPSMSTDYWWVAGPGGPRTNPAFYPQGEKYCRDLVDLFRGDSRLLMWDAMNEPEAVTFYVGDDTAYGFARHFAEYLKSIDDTHPVTVGMAHAEHNLHAADVVDAVSFHPYAKDRDDLVQRLARARDVAEGKPILATETGMPFWGCPYELVLPYLREEGVGSYFWEVMIGRDVLRTTGGIFYPDGAIRRRAHVEAVLGRKLVPGREADGFVKKPDSAPGGVPLEPMKGASFYGPRQLARLLATPIDDETAWERVTFLWSVANPMTIAPDEVKPLADSVMELLALMREGRRDEAYPRIESLLRAAQTLHWTDQPLFHPEVTTCLDEEGTA